MYSANPNLLKAYHRATHTVSKTRQVVMLYDGAVRFMQQASEAMEKKDYEARYHKLTRVSEILMGLQSCLDFEQGAVAAQTLYDFYSAMDARVMALHRSNDVDGAKALITELKQMRDVWDKIDRGGEADNAESASAPQTPGPDLATTVSA